MIQRIQTLYMFVAIAAMVTCAMFPIATFDLPDTSADKLSGQLCLLPASGGMEGEIAGVPLAFSQNDFIGVWPLTAILGLAAVTTVVSIFMYKNRIRQMRFVMLPFLLTLIYLFLVFIWAVDAYVDRATVPFSQPGSPLDVTVTYGIGTWAAAVALLFLFLANRAIKKDEAKVRAADRLR